MKKLLALLLALMMLFSVATIFAGCEDSGKKKSSSSKREDDDNEDEEENENEGKDENKQEDEGKQEDDGKQEASEDVEEDPFAQAKKAVDQYFDVFYCANAKLLEQIAPEEFWLNNGFTFLDSVDELDEIIDIVRQNLPDAVSLNIDSLVQQSGDNVTFDYEIISTDMMEAETVSGIADALAERYHIDASKVTSGIEFTIDLTISGNDSEETLENSQVSCICYDGMWYLVSGLISDSFNGTTLYIYDFNAEFILYIIQSYLDSQGWNEENTNQDISSAEQALQDYIDVFYYGNADKLEASAPREFWDAVCEDYSLNDLKEAMPDYIAEMKEMTTEEVGENYFVNVVVTDNTPMDAELLNNCVDVLAEDYGIDPELVLDGCVLTCDMTAGGDESEETMTGAEMYMICYDGAWYPIEVDAQFYDDEDMVYCEFFVTYLLWTLENYLG